VFLCVPLTRPRIDLASAHFRGCEVNEVTGAELKQITRRRRIALESAIHPCRSQAHYGHLKLHSLWRKESWLGVADGIRTCDELNCARSPAFG